MPLFLQMYLVPHSRIILEAHYAVRCGYITCLVFMCEVTSVYLVLKKFLLL
jgi:hypothetical protein